MKRLFIVFFIIISATLAGILVNEVSGDANIQTIRVSDSREFLEALGSDRIIILKPGKYNLSEWDPYLDKSEQKLRYSNIKKHGNLKLAKGVSWSDETFDGGELGLTGIKNLTIRGLSAEKKSEIIVDPRYIFVLKFDRCSNIVIDRLTAGHSQGGYCVGGVFYFIDSSRIKIISTNMYGCGTIGLALSNVSDMKVSLSKIYECTYGIMDISAGKNITFEKCIFRDNQEFTMIGVSAAKNISFIGCEFIKNSGTEMFSVGDTTVSVSNSIFKGNKIQSPIDGSDNVMFSNCKFD